MKRIIIVGSSSGIGKELAMLYAADGHFVGITGRRSDLLEEMKSLNPYQFYCACFDVTGTEIKENLSRLVSEMGGLDLLIYNSGFGEPSEALIEEIEIATTKTNVNGFVEAIAFAFNYFVDQGHGQIALTSSVAAMRGNSWAPAYSASKAFMSNYAEGLNLKAKRLKKDIVITDLKPGFIKTKMAKGPGQFWAASVSKAAIQIKQAIDKRKRLAYITRRWWLIAQIMKFLPYSLYKQIA